MSNPYNQDMHDYVEKSERKPLTDEEIDYMWEIIADVRNFARAIEKAHGIGVDHEG